MKTLHVTSLTIFLSLAFVISAWAQTIHLVNPVGAPEGANSYTTIQAAVDAASDGDIIHVFASSEDYPKLELSKSLQLIGQGFFRETSIAGIDLLDGSSGTLIDGFYLTEHIAIKGNIGGLAIRNCVLDSHRLILDAEGSAAGVLIQNIIFNSTIVGASKIDFGTGSNHQNVVISNNIFTRSAGTTSGNGDISIGNEAQISFNLFFGSTTSSYRAFSIAQNVIIQNNKFFGKQVGLANAVQNSIFNNNLIYSASTNSFPIGSNNNTGSGNITDQDPQFADLETSSAAWNFTWDASLEEGSPAIGAATDGTDIGLFGGPNPFNTRGATLPEILEIVMPNFVGTGQNVEVNIKARGN